MSKAIGQVLGYRYPNEFEYQSSEPAELEAAECAAEDGIARCLVPDCEKPIKSKALCMNHYQQQRRARMREENET